MRTNCALSAIAYPKSPDVFKATLDDLVRQRVLTLYAFIPHRGEVDDYGEVDKDHYHVLFVPFDTVDTKKLAAYIEDGQGGSIFYKIEKCRSCGDWVLYAYHDPEYLASKGEVRQYTYAFSDIVTNDQNALVRYRRDVKLTYKPSYNVIAASVRNGLTDADLLRRFDPTASQYNAFISTVRGVRSDDVAAFTRAACDTFNAVDITDQTDTDDMPF